MKDHLRSLEARIRVGLAMALVALAVSGCAQANTPTPAEVFSGTQAPAPTETATPDPCAGLPKAASFRDDQATLLANLYARRIPNPLIEQCLPYVVVNHQGVVTAFSSVQLTNHQITAPELDINDFVCFGTGPIQAILGACKGSN